ncbi:MAG: hypothetical protein A2508_02715 [Candidatus Lambdaproteobacteria bacterium RIFOXYD12_FULL_49_8]|uniref:HTH luxR-type domain-containing protein n=1 Tax=Candidatus Lambdaproteobacteria bacterium RIFOXYD2_FULL_50_16 TaxID=1817772 RepID=A0A1F6GGC3_9PROT|nr:MAG: hypothetical protein A2527_10885 [Candidatus Lambdaproteobacteria bacterium RIFOXYD2_FULL_50_16]OGG98314.1 MAG: hypothetical protein A2508_02715 [Candidatus Lambdaproteobacteria bacterium RIFOXYD12_FULL_49_8]
MKHTPEAQASDTDVSYCSPQDAYLLLDLINRCIQSNQSEDLDSIFEGLKGLIRFKYLSFTLAELNEDDLLLSLEQHLYDWPILDAPPKQNKSVEQFDPVFSLLAGQKFEHHYWNLAAFEYPGASEWYEIARQAGLAEGYAVRSYTHNKNEFSQIDLAGGVEFNRRTEFILDTVKPHIHKACTLIKQKQGQSILDQREKLILQLLQRGMNRRMIADELVISESRTQQLMNKIYTKLDAHNAPHAVAISLSKGLIYFA